MSSIDLQSYCADPSKYSKEPEYIKDYYSNLCRILENAKTEQEKEQSTATRWATAGGAIGQFLADLPYMMTVGQFQDNANLTFFLIQDVLASETIQSLFQKSGNTVIKFASEYMRTVGYEAIKRLTENVATRITGGLGRFLINNAVLTRALVVGTQATINLTTGVVRGTVRGFLYLLGAAFNAVAALGALMAALNVLFLVQMFMMVSAMIIDSIDPCDLNKALDAEAIQNWSDRNNKVFKEQILGTETMILSPYKKSLGATTKTAEGITVPSSEAYNYVRKWPIDIEVQKQFPIWVYLADETPEMKKIRWAEFGLSLEREIELETKLVQLKFKYLINQKFNVFGQPVTFDQTIPFDEVPDITPAMMDILGQKFIEQFSNNNSVVSRWLVRYSPVILFTIGVILFLVFKYV
jgi:hypothetical protein